MLSFLTDRSTIMFIVAKEIIHTLQKKMIGKYGSVAIKLDMGKAFDLVEWGFLDSIMKKMGFPMKFFSLIMSCIFDHFSLLFFALY